MIAGTTPAVLGSIALAALSVSCRPQAAPLPSPPRPVETVAEVEMTTPIHEPPPDPVVAVVRTQADDALWNAMANPQEIRERAVIRRRGALRVGPDAAPIIVGDGGATFDEVPVLAVEGAQVRVLVPMPIVGVTMALWVEAADLEPQITRAQGLRGSAALTFAPGDGEVMLAAGEPIVVVERDGAAAKVRTRDGRHAGWIDAAALGTTFVTLDFELPNVKVALPAGSTLSVRPGGPRLFTLPADRRALVGLISERRGWFEVDFVAVCEEGVRVRGWARSKGVERLEPGGGGAYACGVSRGGAPVRWGELESAPELAVPMDTALRDAGGALIGRTTGAVALRRARGTVWVTTAWGVIPVRTDP